MRMDARMKRVVLRAKRDFSVRRHHPWIFSGAVLAADDGVGVGETVAVAAADGEVLGFGAYSPASQIRVRMFAFGSSPTPDAAFVADLVKAAVLRRGDAAADGDARRLVNAENDSLPGVVVDDYAGNLVCQFTSAFGEHWRDAIVATLMKTVVGARGVSERRDIEVRAKEGLSVEPAFSLLAGEEPPKLVEIREGGIKFLVDVRAGHKTGFYLDQREARRFIGELSKGRTVLNCFAYTGGFGLYAAAGGAKAVTQVEISAAALELAKQNAELNFPASQSLFNYLDADVFQFLRKCRDEGRTFDLIVLDPPKFAAVKSQVMKAARGYKDINLLAMKLLNPGGILATFSCSGAMTAELFDKVLQEAAADAGRDFQVLAHTRQATDHPVALSFPEGFYLKGVILRQGM